MRSWLEALKRRAKDLPLDATALWLAYRHPRTPWYAKALAIAVVGYALSPIDLIPDFVPVLGALDDLLIVPAGVKLAIKLIPAEVMQDCRARAGAAIPGGQGSRLAGIGIVVGAWLVTLVVIGLVVSRLVRGRQ